jgi:hypothetical protein
VRGISTCLRNTNVLKTVTTFKTLYKREHGLAVRNTLLQLELRKRLNVYLGFGGKSWALLGFHSWESNWKGILNTRHVASVAFPTNVAEWTLLEGAEM